ARHDAPPGIRAKGPADPGRCAHEMTAAIAHPGTVWSDGGRQTDDGTAERPAALHRQVAERRPHRDGVFRSVRPRDPGRPSAGHRARPRRDGMTAVTFALLIDGSTI